MATHSSVLQRCFEEAATSSARGLQRSIDEAIADLQAEESTAAKVALRDRLALAWNSLLKQRPSLPQAYSEGLRAAFSAAVAGAPVEVAPNPSRFAALTSGGSGFGFNWRLTQ